MEDLEQYRQQILSQLKLSVSEQDDLETETDPDIQRLNDQIVRLQQELAKLNQDKANIRAQKADELGEDDELMREYERGGAWNDEGFSTDGRYSNWGRTKMPSPKQIAFAKSLGVDNADGYESSDDLSWAIDQKMAERNKPSEKQISFAKSLGIENPESMTKKELSMAISSAKGVNEEFNDEEFDDVELEEGDSDLRVGTAQGMLSKIPQDKVAEIIKNLSPEEYQKFAGGLQSDALHAIFNNQGGGEVAATSPEGGEEISPEDGEQEAGGEPDLASLL